MIILVRKEAREPHSACGNCAIKIKVTQLVLLRFSQYSKTQVLIHSNRRYGSAVATGRQAAFPEIR
jgi:hypothetical protein